MFLNTGLPIASEMLESNRACHARAVQGSYVCTDGLCTDWRFLTAKAWDKQVAITTKALDQMAITVDDKSNGALDAHHKLTVSPL